MKARIAELEAKLERERGQRVAERNPHVMRLRAAAENPKQQRPESRGAAGKGDSKLMKLIRRLDSPDNDNEAAGALRMLAGELQARGRGFQELADLTAQWDQEDAAARPPKPKPVDWSEVESVIKTYTEGKTKVTVNAVSKPVYAHVRREQEPELREHGVGFIDRCLRGFVRRGESTYERTAAKAASSVS
jgi:hypothetical protein